MKLKLSHAEFTALHTLLAAICTGITPGGIQAHVLHGVLFRVYKKFYRKAIDHKKKYAINLDDDEACAFYMFFTKEQMPAHDVFTINLLTQITNNIHQKYAS